MGKKLSKNKNGFTIIEVVIVLALAAFIFTIVFFAVPQLQRALRNNQRERDVSRVAAAITEFKAAHEGRLPVNAPTTQRNEDRAWLENHMGGNEFEDVSGNRYAVIVGGWWNADYGYYSSTERDLVYISVNSECDSSRTRASGPADAGTSVSVKLYAEGSDTTESRGIVRATRFFCETVTR